MPLIPAHRSRLAGLIRELVALDQGECICISAIIFNLEPIQKNKEKRKKKKVDARAKLPLALSPKA
jgi:hypothetical protein